MERTETGQSALSSEGRAARGPVFWTYLLGPPLVVVMVITAVLGVRTLYQSLGWVVHTREVRESLTAALGSLLDAEAAQRGYLLTSDSLYAQQFSSARARLPAELDSLRQLTADNPTQQTALRELDTLLDERLGAMERLMSLRSAGLDEDAGNGMQAGQGRVLTADIRERFVRMQTEEERLLRSRTGSAERAQRSALAAIVGTGLVAFGLLELLRFLSSRERRQRTLRESHLAEQARLLDLSRDAIIVRDAADRVRYWSQGAIDLYGYSREEALGRVTHQLLQTGSEQTLEQIRGQLEESGRWQGELQHSTRAGGRITTLSTWTLNRDPAGRLQSILEANNDITARKSAEDLLKSSRERLEFALRAAKIGFWEWDAATNRSLWNEQEFALLGIPPTADGIVSTGSFFEHVVEEDRLALQANLSAVFAGGGEFSHEFRVTHPEGGVRWLAGRGRVVRDTGREPSRMIGLNWDISDVKDAHAQLQRSNHELAKLTSQLEDRVAERTRELREANTDLESFARSVAHDLRAPLRTMQGFATALIEDYSGELPAEGQAFARRIASAAERMDSLILDLLEYARLSREEMQLEPVPLQPVWDTIVSELSDDLRRTGARLEARLDSVAVLANRTLLTQVLSNLVSNAFKFVAAGTKPRVQVFSDGDGERVRVSVIDNGIGIASEHHERIFGVFERLHGFETYPGTGIGLAIVRRAVERMGGRAGVFSEVGQGSRFWFELAQAQDERSSVGTSRHQPPEAT